MLLLLLLRRLWLLLTPEGLLCKTAHVGHDLVQGVTCLLYSRCNARVALEGLPTNMVE